MKINLLENTSEVKDNVFYSISNNLDQQIKSVNNLKDNYKDKNIYQKIKTFPKTRYYGSKKRLLPWIYDNLKDLEFNTVLDGFGGTSSVSLLFKAMEKDITYNDIFKWNTISAKVLLDNKFPTKVIKAEEFIDSIESLENNFIYNNYKNVFYTDDENKWLDGAIIKINSVKNQKVKRLYLYCLFQACLMKRPFNLFHRANLNLRINNVERQFGNLTTWNTSFPKLMKSILIDVHSLMWDNGKNIKVLSNNVQNINKKFDLVYLDPPYVADGNNDNYLKRYHFLEGLCNYEKWEDKINEKTKIKVYESTDEIRKWEDKKNFKKRLFNLIKKHKDSIVVLSYMTNAIPSITEISKFFEEHFSQVTVSTYNLNHALAKTKRTEVLIIGEP